MSPEPNHFAEVLRSEDDPPDDRRLAYVLADETRFNYLTIELVGLREASLGWTTDPEKAITCFTYDQARAFADKVRAVYIVVPVKVKGHG